METINFELTTMHNEITNVVNVYNYNVNNETNKNLVIIIIIVIKTFQNKIKRFNWSFGLNNAL
jgi:hypothetical protein